MKITEQCRASGCEQPGVASLESCPFCRDHFISTCYAQLEECTRRLQDQHSRYAESESVRQFLADCARGAADLAQVTERLDNLQRAQLLDILLWAGELSRRLRRSIRRPVSVRVHLRSEKLGRTWEEDAETQMLSRHGAMLECQHPVETGDILEVVQLDTGRQAQARVVWHRRKGSGRIEIGLAFPDSENFWNFP